MFDIKLRRTTGFLILVNLLHGMVAQSSIFNQTPFQQRQTVQPFNRQPLQQQLQQRQQNNFPNNLNNLNNLNPLSPLASPLATISPFGQQAGYRNFNQLGQINPQPFVPITAYQNELNYDGSFSYGYSAGDGTTAQAQGFVKNLGLGEAVEAQVIQGSYSYTSPEGTPITVRYIADENGFRAEGAHIPTPPTIPGGIVKPLDFIGQQPYGQGAVLNPNLNPYQTPFRQFPVNSNPLLGQGLGQGQGQLTALQLQQQQQQQQVQQQQRFFNQQNSGQYQPQNAFGLQGQPQQQTQQQQPQQFNLPFGARLGSNFNSANDASQNQQNLTLQQQQQLAQQQAQQQQQQQQQQGQQQQGQQQKQQNDQQQQLVTQELRGRPDQFVNPYGDYNQYRRYKKSATKNYKH